MRKKEPRSYLNPQNIPDVAVVYVAVREQRAGDRFILWTCRVGERLEEAVNWSAAQGLTFDAVNDNLRKIGPRSYLHPQKVPDVAVVYVAVREYLPAVVPIEGDQRDLVR